MFNISVLFIAILIAQFYQSFDEFTKKAHENVIVKKTEIMQNMDELLMCLPCCHKCVSEYNICPETYNIIVTVCLNYCVVCITCCS